MSPALTMTIKCKEREAKRGLPYSSTWCHKKVDWQQRVCAGCQFDNDVIAKKKEIIWQVGKAGLDPMCFQQGRMCHWQVELMQSEEIEDEKHTSYVA